MKKYIGYTIIGLVLLPLGIILAVGYWPIFATMLLMDWLFDYDERMLFPAVVCGLVFTIGWMSFLGYLSKGFC